MRCLPSLAFLFFGAASACGSEDEPHSCAVVRPVDECCSAPLAVRTDALASDACLQDALRPPDVSTCPGAQACHGMSCSYPLSGASWTRVATAAGDGCSFASECESDADCALATDESVCCSCPEAIPKRLLGAEGCWAAPGDGPPVGCDVCVEVLSCAACPDAASAAPRCVTDATGLNKCLLN